MPGILFVHGGRALAREVFATEGRCEWSQALPLVLEKHGYLSLEEAGPDVLADPRALEGFDAVLVARMPEGTWTADVAEALVEGAVPVLAEGPFPLTGVLGSEQGDPAPDGGAIMVVEPALRAAAAAFGAQPGVALTLATRTPVDRAQELDWTAIPDVSLTGEQAAAWRARGWDVRRWSRGGQATVLCEWVSSEPGHERCPAVARNGSLTACSFGMFAFLVQRHSIEPYDGAEWRATDRCIGLEVALLAMLDEMHRRSGAVRARVLPWPAGRRWSCSLRHDVNTQPAPESLERILGAHEDEQTAATWYWPSSLASDAVERVAEAERQEVGLLAELLWAGSGERAALERSIGRPAKGVASGASSVWFRYQGAPNLLWAEREDFAFTELLGRSHFHPHRAPVLEPDGTVRPLALVCLPHYVSLDILAGDRDRLSNELSLWVASGGFLQLTQRLDGEVPANLAALTAAADRADRWDATAGDVADWWRRTHMRDALVFRARGDGRFELRATEAARGVCVELLHPDGSREVVTVDVEAGSMQLEVTPRMTSRPVSWDQSGSVYERNLEAFFAARGSTPGDPLVRRTIDNNTVDTEARGENLVRLAADLIGRSELEHVRILDVGCGFGALSTYLAWRTGAHVVATDIDAAILATATTAARELCVDETPRFVLSDVRDLRGIPDWSADLAIVDGALMYTPAGAGASSTLGAIRRVLGPGGCVIFYHRKRPPWRDAFTGRRLIHLLPGWLQRRRWIRLGDRDDQWRHWFSPVKLRLRLRRAGFQDVRLVGFGESERHDRRFIRYRDRSYAMGALARGPLGVRLVAPPPATCDRPAQLPIRDWEEPMRVYRDEINAHYRRRGISLDTPSTRATIDTNTVLVPQRGDNLLRYAAELLGYRSCEGLRVLEVGCGSGALATYLLWRGRFAKLVAIDYNETWLAIATSCAARLGISEPLQFVKSDMRTLEGVEQEPFDMILVNNSFIYLRTARAAIEALDAFHDRLVPGGGLLFHHANKWRLREPFTSDPLVHLLRPSAAKLVSKITGWRHNHGRVRLLSPVELRRHLRRTGFKPIATVALSDPPRARGIRRNLGTFTVQAAIKR